MPGVDMHALAARSEWLGVVPGLREQAEAWLLEAPELRRAAEDEGAHIALPRINASSSRAIGSTAARFALLLASAARDWTVALATRGRAQRQLGARSVGVTRQAERIVRAGGPAYVKFGQFIASARGMVSDDLVDSMQWCCDEVPPLPAGVARQTVERSFGRPVSALFASFDDKPFAAASIAQVHAARLHDGQEVVVKVRRPGLSARFARDIGAMAVLAWVASKASGRARVVNLPGVIDLFARLCMQELDLRVEALNMVEVGLAIEDAGQVGMRVPRPVPGMVAREVLVMERVPGVRHSEAASVHSDGIDGPALLRVVVANVLEQAFLYGVFHGDLHAGNVLIDGDGNFSLVDFGIVARLNDVERASLMRFNLGSATKDPVAQVRALQDLGAIPRDADVDAIAPVLGAQQERMDEVMNRPRDQVDFADLGAQSAQMVKLLLEHGFRLPLSLVLFSKNMLYLNALADSLAPDANIMSEMDEVVPYFLQKYPELIASLTGAQNLTPESAA